MINLRLNREQLERLILMLCTVDGQAVGTSPPSVGSPDWAIFRILTEQLKALC